MTTLAEIQTWFSDAVVENRPSDRAQSHAILAPSSRQSTEERLEIYTHDFWPRVLDSLADDFPELLDHWGWDRFNDHVRRYIAAYPSHSFTLFHLGQFFPRFIGETYSDPDKEVVHELATLEWARLAASIAENRRPFDPSALTPAQQTELADTQISIHPSVHIIRRNGTDTVVYRRDYEVFEREIDPRFAKILQAMRSGATLSGAVAVVSGTMSDPESSELATHIQSWFQLAVHEHWFEHPLS